MPGEGLVRFIAVLALGSGVLIVIVALGIRLAERAVAPEDPDPLEVEVFGKRHVRRIRRKEARDSPPGRLLRVGGLLVAGGLLVLALVEFLSRVV